MALPILNELHDEITRLYIAGSSLAAGDPRVKKYIPQLQKLGEKAPVFTALAERLTALTQADAARSPEALMEAGGLLYSLRYTQGTTETGKESKDMAYAEKPLVPPQTPYSSLAPLMSQLTSGSQERADRLEAVYEAGTYKDPRLFDAYCQAIIDKNSDISKYTAAVILPAIGADIIPFAEAALDLKGGEGHARLFKVLHSLKEKDILPLAEQALAEGSAEVIVEAIRSLGEDPKYEETLLGYTKDKKSGPKEAAFTALIRMGSAKGEAALIEALKKANIGHLEEALLLTQNPVIYQKTLEEAQSAIPSFKDKASKLKILLRVLAARDEEAGLHFIGQTLKDPEFYAQAVGILDLYAVIQVLFEGNTKLKNKLLYRLSENNESLRDYKIKTAVRLFSAEEVYDRCSKDIAKEKNQWNCFWRLQESYHIERNCHIPDGRKTWDRRWAALFMKKGNESWIYTFLYDDDEQTWNKLLDQLVKAIKKENYYDKDFFGEVLAQAFTNKHPQAQYYREQFIAAGFPSEELDLMIRQPPADSEQ